MGLYIVGLASVVPIGTPGPHASPTEAAQCCVEWPAYQEPGAGSVPTSTSPSDWWSSQLSAPCSESLFRHC